MTLLLVVALALPAPPAPAARAERARVLMGTVCTAVVDAADTAAAAAAIAAAFDEIARLEVVMSSWRSDSELSRLNAAAAARPFACSADLDAAIDSALAAARETDGAFDPTVEPLNRAWDLRGRGRVPRATELDSALARVGWRGVTRDPATRSVRFSSPGMGLDLGGIGKGYALDRAAAQLGERGARRALVNFGGEVLARSDGPAWTVTVAHPNDRLRPVVALEIANSAVSTSGQSERGVEVRGRRYGHILEPSTGRPLERAASVTVVAASATRADALSTALLVMGRERAAEFATRNPELGVLWLEPAGDAVPAWKWNLPSAAALPGAAVRWMNDTSTQRTSR